MFLKKNLNAPRPSEHPPVGGVVSLSLFCRCGESTRFCIVFFFLQMGPHLRDQVTYPTYANVAHPAYDRKGPSPPSPVNAFAFPSRCNLRTAFGIPRQRMLEPFLIRPHAYPSAVYFPRFILRTGAPLSVQVTGRTTGARCENTNPVHYNVTHLAGGGWFSEINVQHISPIRACG